MFGMINDRRIDLVGSYALVCGAVVGGIPGTIAVRRGAANPIIERETETRPGGRLVAPQARSLCLTAAPAGTGELNYTDNHAL